MIDGYDTIMVSFIAPLIAKQYTLGLQQIGNLFAIGYAGAILGAFCAGALADRIGRKPILYLFLALSGVCTLLCAATTSFETLLLARFFAGVGLGGAVPSLVSLTAEHAPAQRRSATVTIMYIGYPVGAVVGGLITAAFIKVGWREIFIGGGIAAVAMVLLALLIPETLTAVRIRRSIPLGEQFAEGRLGAVIMLWIGLFCMLLVTYLLLTWTPTIAVRSGFTPTTAALSGVVLNLGGVVGALAMGPIVNRHGPFMPAVCMVGASTVMIAVLGRSFGSQTSLMTTLFAVGFTAIGGQLIAPAMAVHLFPLHVRGAGTGSVFAVGRLGSIVGPIVGSALLSITLPLPRLFEVVALAAATAAIAFAVALRLQPSVLRQSA